MRTGAIAAIITSYNEYPLCLDAVSSVISQDSESLEEIVVVDDGSTDGSPDALDAEFSSDRRFTLLRRDNHGLAAARNAGIALSSSPWIALLDGDDLWLPGRLAAVAAAIESKPDAGVFYSDLNLFTDDHRRHVRARSIEGTGRAARDDYLRHDAPIIPSTATIRRSVLETVGLFDESLRSAEDTDLWLRILGQAEAVRIPRTLVDKRDHPGSLGKRRALKVESMERVVAKAVAADDSLAQAGRVRMARSQIVRCRQAADEGEIGEALRSALNAVRATPTRRRPWLAVCYGALVGGVRAAQRLARTHGSR
ncbi:MAG: glycosyltransferase family 2 protein [Acidimicrobiales bacterium]